MCLADDIHKMSKHGSLRKILEWSTFINSPYLDLWWVQPNTSWLYYKTQVSNYVWYYIFQIQETARSIIQNLEGDLDSEPTLPMPSPGDNTSVDKAADKWSMAFCEFYRDD